jgi:hypothetical protein
MDFIVSLVSTTVQFNLHMQTFKTYERLIGMSYKILFTFNQLFIPLLGINDSPGIFSCFSQEYLKKLLATWVKGWLNGNHTFKMRSSKFLQRFKASLRAICLGNFLSSPQIGLVSLWYRRGRQICPKTWESQFTGSSPLV